MNPQKLSRALNAPPNEDKWDFFCRRVLKDYSSETFDELNRQPDRDCPDVENETISERVSFRLEHPVFYLLATGVVAQIRAKTTLPAKVVREYPGLIELWRARIRAYRSLHHWEAP